DVDDRALIVDVVLALVLGGDLGEPRVVEQPLAVRALADRVLVVAAAVVLEDLVGQRALRDLAVLLAEDRARGDLVHVGGARRRRKKRDEDRGAKEPGPNTRAVHTAHA